MPLPIRRILALAVTFSLTLAAAFLVIHADTLLPAERPISLQPKSQAIASLTLFGSCYTLDLTIAAEVLTHLRSAALTAFPLVPQILYSTK